MAVLKYRDPTTQAWVSLPAIEGPAGPAGPTGPAGPMSAGGLDQATADTLYVNVTGDTMTGNLTLGAATAGVIFSIGNAGIWAGTGLDTISVLDALGNSFVPLNVAPPVTPTNAATKQYTDDKILHGTAAPTGVYPAGTIYAQYS